MSDATKTVKERAIELIAEKTDHQPEELKMETTFTDLGADSLDRVELILEFEKEFKITIPDEAAEKINTVGDAVSYLENNVK